MPENRLFPGVLLPAAKTMPLEKKIRLWPEI
jgi:hypothetical protein